MYVPDQIPCLTTRCGATYDDQQQQPIAFTKTHKATSTDDPEIWRESDTCPTLNTSDNTSDIRATTVVRQVQVRRLTPLETDRLMSWHDDHTRFRADGTEVSDSVRYRMCGNGIGTAQFRPIAARLAAVLASGSLGEGRDLDPEPVQSRLF